ncbi:MAG: YidC/Oxa1 family membrane protein insertase [Treponema sp.]|nr:YidC/Oxa1 family membrane protein insertase [Treponema sp.]
MLDFLYTLVIYPITLCIECIYTLFNRFTDNAGFCIIGVSAGVTLLCLPLYAVAEHWQEVERDKVKSMKAQLDRIKKCFTGDERYMMTTTYYRQCHYNPIMALRSSFGLLIQIPFFIAAYGFLSHLPALTGEKFLFIQDMGKADALFYIGSFQVNILPIAMTLINCLSGILYSKGHGIREKVQIFAMAAIFLVLLYDSPSGLVLYWTFNNIFSLVKNIFYKFKNPIRVFWITVCLALIPFVIFLSFFTTTKWKFKIVFIFIVAVVYALPVILTKMLKLLDGILKSLHENSKLKASFFFSSTTLLFFLNGFVIPSELLSSSTVEFAIALNQSPLNFVLNTAAQSAGIFLFWLPCFYFLYNSKVKTFLSLFMLISGIYATLNTFLFNISYGDISTSLIFLSSSIDFKTISIISIANIFTAILISFLLFLALNNRLKSLISSIPLIVSIAFIVVSAANIKAIHNSYSEYMNKGNKTEAKKIEPIFHLSKNKENVVIFMLDRSEGEYIHSIFEEDEGLKDIYSGFTHYNNCISFNSHTFQGVPGLFGGYEYTPLEMNKRDSESLKDKHNQSLLLLPRILTEQADFIATVTDPSWSNYSDYMDLSIFSPYEKINACQTYGFYTSIWNERNKENTGKSETSSKTLKRNLLFFSFFRSSPVILRELIYKKGTFWSTDNSNDENILADWYAPLDFLPELTEISDSDRGAYVCMVNEFSHENTFLQAPDYVPTGVVTNYGSSEYKKSKEYHTSIAAIKRIGDWIQYIKENGIYDNTRIILVSDHGNSGNDKYMEDDEELDKALFGGDHYGRGRFHCLLMVKDFNSNSPFTQDQTTFMTNADLPSIALKGILDHPVNPYTNKEITLDTSSLKKDGVIISICDKHVPIKHKKNIFSIEKDQWWLVKDSIFKSKNWKKVNPFNE